MQICERVLDRRVIVVLVVAFAVSVGWASVANAQAPFDVQYGSPTDSVGDLSGLEGGEASSEAGESGAAGLLGVSVSEARGEAAGGESAEGESAGGEAAESSGASALQGVEAGTEDSGASALQGVEAGSQSAQGSSAQGSAAAEGADSFSAEQGAVAAIGLLPDTGGPLLVFVAVVVAALSGLGLLAIRRIGRS